MLSSLPFVSVISSYWFPPLQAGLSARNSWCLMLVSTLLLISSSSFHRLPFGFPFLCLSFFSLASIIFDSRRASMVQLILETVMLRIRFSSVNSSSSSSVWLLRFSHSFRVQRHLPRSYLCSECGSNEGIFQSMHDQLGTVWYGISSHHFDARTSSWRLGSFKLFINLSQ